MITNTPLSVSEAANSLNGFDEDFIADKGDGNVIEDLLVERPRFALRLLAACVVAHDLTGDDARAKAFEHAQGLTMGQINAFFTSKDDEDEKTDPPLVEAPTLDDSPGAMLDER